MDGSLDRSSATTTKKLNLNLLSFLAPTSGRRRRGRLAPALARGTEQQQQHRSLIVVAPGARRRRPPRGAAPAGVKRRKRSGGARRGPRPAELRQKRPSAFSSISPFRAPPGQGHHLGGRRGGGGRRGSDRRSALRLQQLCRRDPELSVTPRVAFAAAPARRCSRGLCRALGRRRPRSRRAFRRRRGRRRRAKRRRGRG